MLIEENINLWYLRTIKHVRNSKPNGLNTFRVSRNNETI